jgi:mycothiol synthase
MDEPAMPRGGPPAGEAPAAPPRPPPLEMVWPARLLGNPPAGPVPEGCRLRQFRPQDRAAYLDLMRLAGFQDWGEDRLDGMLKKILPRGFFVIEERATGLLVATAMATHNPEPRHPFGGELGWVAGHPGHARRGLGRAVCAAVVRRYSEINYERIYLKTDDWRLAALKVYLGLGFEPLLYLPEMAARWEAVCRALGRPFTPEAWPKA